VADAGNKEAVCLFNWPVLVVIFLAVLTHGLVGFGSSMVAMALLPHWMSLREAAPLVSLVVGTLEVALLVRYHAAVKWRAIWRVGLGMLVGVPIGVWALDRLNASVLTVALGLLIVAYSVYALLNLHVPRLQHPGWAVGFGLLAGVLAGLFNFAGPVVIIYGQCRQWESDEFKGNLQALFLVNQVLVIINRALAGTFTASVLQNYLSSLPVMVIGVVVALGLARLLSPGTYRRLALIMLLILGAQLLV